MSSADKKLDVSADEDRRKFLASCGRFAVVTPPTITLLLSTSLHSTAIAASGASDGRGNNGNHGDGNNGNHNGAGNGNGRR